MSDILVPPLDDMRKMSDSELMFLRTDISYDHSLIESQLRDPDSFGIPRTEEWERKAKAAQYARARGMNAIKNILAERSSSRDDSERVPLHFWLARLMQVTTASQELIRCWENDDEFDEALISVKRSVESLEEFKILPERIPA